MVELDWEELRFGDVLTYEQPTKYLVRDTNYSDSGSTPVLTAGKTFILGFTSETDGVYTSGPTILFDDFTTATQWVDFPFKVKSSACKMLTARAANVNLRFVFECMRVRAYTPSNHMRHWIEIFSKFPIRMPPPQEQDAIGQVLSDADKLIGSLSALISKKQDLRLAAIQHYINPSASSFSGEVLRLGDVIKVEKGEPITAATAKPGNVPVIAGGIEPAYFTSAWNRRGLTITISASGANAGYVSLRQGPIWASDCSTISESDTYDIHFVASQLQARQSQIYQVQFGGAQPHVRPKDIEALEIYWLPVEGQRKIGAMAAAMDAEIAALAAKRNKVELLKQGMMQALLFGKVRLT